MEWATLPLKRYAEFTGRSRRMEYWSFVALMFAANVGIWFVGLILGSVIERLLSLVYLLAFIVPSIAVGIRRLHDTNRSGWWLLLWLVPIVGWIVLIVFLATEGVKGPNEYGADPKLLGPGAAERFA
jgi:uncharacterized membrane protein YhaH (DUF805 family)